MQTPEIGGREGGAAQSRVLNKYAHTHNYPAPSYVTLVLDNDVALYTCAMCWLAYTIVSQQNSLVW